MNRQTASYRDFSPQAVKWINAFRMLWEEHVMWTRSFIVSKAADAPDLEFVTKRLLRNSADFAEAIAQFYGEESAMAFKKLMEEHLSIAAKLVGALKDKHQREADEARRAWYKNADAIAAALSKLNPYWDQRMWQRMFYEHLQITEREAMLRLMRSYSADIQAYDVIEKQALKMADMMSYGIIQMFSL